ncbi:MAG: hypothetical protein IKN18_03420, partial [Neisseriaceae bacterium]|nr:hypothetical protein [Neisseriaceae bacterium]
FFQQQALKTLSIHKNKVKIKCLKVMQTMVKTHFVIDKRKNVKYSLQMLLDLMGISVQILAYSEIFR